MKQCLISISGPFLLGLIFLIKPNNSHSQKFPFISLTIDYRESYSCSYFLYALVENPIKLESKLFGKFGLRTLQLKSDSVIIRKLNDTVYGLTPLYPNKGYKILIQNNKGLLIDSFRFTSIEQPFWFSIRPQFAHFEYLNAPIYAYSMHLPFLSTTGCIQYEKEYEIISYNIVLKRKDSVLIWVSKENFEENFKDFKDRFVQLTKVGDMLSAENVCIRHKQSPSTHPDLYIKEFILFFAHH